MPVADLSRTSGRPFSYGDGVTPVAPARDFPGRLRRPVEIGHPPPGALGGGRRLRVVDTFLAALAALTPPVGVGLLFYVAIKALMNADRNERTALARLEAEESARRTVASPTAADDRRA
jgi:hypothetical protein